MKNPKELINIFNNIRNYLTKISLIETLASQLIIILYIKNQFDFYKILFFSINNYLQIIQNFNLLIQFKDLKKNEDYSKIFCEDLH